jgi:hypothetical protein
MTTLQTKIDNLTTLISDMQAGKYPKGMGMLAEFNADLYAIDNPEWADKFMDENDDEDPDLTETQQLTYRQFCCLGCMAWQVGARPEATVNELRLIDDDHNLRLDTSFPPVFVGEQFGLYDRGWEGSPVTAYDGDIDTWDVNAGELRGEPIPDAYGKLARLNDTSSTFGSLVIPELLVTLGILEVKRAIEQVNEQYPDD